MDQTSTITSSKEKSIHITPDQMTPDLTRLRGVESQIADVRGKIEAITSLLFEMKDLANLNSTKVKSAGSSPYYTKEDAAAYLRTTVDALYGRVERGQLRRCPGVKEYLFTREMLDESVMGRLEKPAPKTSNRRKPR